MLYVVRHGKTKYNKEKLIMGSLDIPLDFDGIKEANELSEKLLDKDIDFIISSPLIRTKQTANIINQKKELDIKTDHRLQERDLGKLEGTPYLSEKENDDLWDINKNISTNEIETMKKFKGRVYRFLDELIEEYSDKNILLVTHGGVSAMINCYFNNNLYDGTISDKFLDNCEIAEYDIKQKVLTR